MKKIQKMAVLKVLSIFFVMIFFIAKIFPHNKVVYVTKGSIIPLDHYTYAIDRKIVVNIDGKNIVVPEGFKTDLASIPRILWSVFPPQYSKYVYPAIVHDFMYETGLTKTRKEADDIFYNLLVNNKVTKPVAFIMWVSVRLFGGLHYHGR